MSAVHGLPENVCHQQRARELLAAELQAAARTGRAVLLLQGHTPGIDAPALRAIETALRQSEPTTSGLVEAARALLELIEGVDEADLLALDSDPHPPSSLSVAAADVRDALAAHDKRGAE